MARIPQKPSESWEVKYDNLLARTQLAGEQWRAEHEKVIDELRQTRRELAKTREERDNYKTEYLLVNRMNDKLMESFDKLFDRTERAMNRALESASHPVVIDPSPIVERLGETISNLLNGPPAQTGQSVVNQAAETAAGVRSGEAAISPQQFIPDLEVDPWMMTQDGPLPTPGEFQVGTPLPLTVDQTPSHGLTPDGRVVRTDGQPMFTQGTGAPPPTGGTE